MESEITQVNVWPEQMDDGTGEAWFFAAWCGDIHDGNGNVPREVTNAAEWAKSQWPQAQVNEVEATA